MGITLGGIPYPEPTDPVAEGADAMKAMALALDPKIVKLISGTGVVANRPLLVQTLVNNQTTTATGGVGFNFPQAFNAAIPPVAIWTVMTGNGWFIQTDVCTTLYTQARVWMSPTTNPGNYLLAVACVAIGMA